MKFSVFQRDSSKIIIILIFLTLMIFTGQASKKVDFPINSIQGLDRYLDENPNA